MSFHTHLTSAVTTDEIVQVVKNMPKNNPLGRMALPLNFLMKLGLLQEIRAAFEGIKCPSYIFGS